ncbi:MAG: hypothetical protein ACRDUV_17765, partial [Pseudonocardiaceae bacterium]
MNPHPQSAVVDLSATRQAHDGHHDGREALLPAPVTADPMPGHDGHQPTPGESAPDSGPDLVEGLVVASETTPLPRTERPRRRVLPVWVRDREAVQAAVRWAVGYYAHCTAFHLVRLPLYWCRLAARAPVGA